MSRVQLRLLGVPTIELDGPSTPVPLNVPASLLLYLAVSGTWVRRGELAYLYRPDDAETEALAYLRLQVHRALAYPWAVGLEVEAQRLRWQVDTDLAALRAAAAAGRWDEAVEKYTGALLDGAELRDKPTYNAWLELEREGCERLYATALVEQAAVLERAGEHLKAADLHRRLGRLDEFAEGPILDLARNLALAGQRDQALKALGDFRKLLNEELGATASEAVDSLGESISSGSLKPSPTAAPRVRHEPAPQPTTRFVGREAELRELRELLTDPDCRLVTIVGLGGSGKTRLLLEVLRQLGKAGTQPVFVSLESASTTQQALLRVAQALDLELDAQHDVAEALPTHLAGRELLLFLDNLEHLPELAGHLATWLAAAPGLQVLAASRVSLGLTPEWLFDLRGLSVSAPDVPGAPAVASAPATAGTNTLTEASEAVQLFVSAARRVAPRLAFGPRELALAARVCGRVEGLPLAIELAAAWLRAVPIERVADEVERDFELLASEASDLPERHRSLAAVLDRTFKELNPSQEDALARLSVFRGGASLEAGEEVTGASLPVLLSLVNQSLITRDASGRLACHALVAEYAGRRLEASPDRAADARDRHAAHYLALLRSFDPRRPAPGSEASLRSLDPEADNIEQAWFHTLGRGGFDELNDSVYPLLHYYNTLGHYHRGIAVVVRALAELPAGAATLALRCGLLLATSSMAREAGDLQLGADRAAEALALAEAEGLASQAAIAHRYFGDAQQFMGRYDEARAAYLRSGSLFKDLGEIAEEANTLNSLASLDAYQERFESATAGFERCVELFEQVGDELAKAIALNNLGYIADAQGFNEPASRYYESSLEAFERIQFARGISAVKNNLVVLYGVLGRLDEAERLGLEALAAKEQMQDRFGLIITLKNLADLELLRAKPAAALAYLEPALATAVEIDAVPRLLQLLPSYAEALLASGDDELAGRVIEAVVSHPLTPQSVRDKASRLRDKAPNMAPNLASRPADGETTGEEALAALLPVLMKRTA